MARTYIARKLAAALSVMYSCFTTTDTPPRIAVLELQTDQTRDSGGSTLSPTADLPVRRYTGCRRLMAVARKARSRPGWRAV